SSATTRSRYWISSEYMASILTCRASNWARKALSCSMRSAFCCCNVSLNFSSCNRNTANKGSSGESFIFVRENTSLTSSSVLVGIVIFLQQKSRLLSYKAMEWEDQQNAHPLFL